MVPEGHQVPSAQATCLHPQCTGTGRDLGCTATDSDSSEQSHPGRLWPNTTPLFSNLHRALPVRPYQVHFTAGKVWLREDQRLSPGQAVCVASMSQPPTHHTYHTALGSLQPVSLEQSEHRGMEDRQVCLTAVMQGSKPLASRWKGQDLNLYPSQIHAYGTWRADREWSGRTIIIQDMAGRER